MTDRRGTHAIEGTVFEIQRYAVHDGPGIRTVVFLKGCPLRCAWCQNPEGLDPRPQIGFLAMRCIKCGTCLEVCPRNAIDLDRTDRVIRDRCDQCGLCVDECVSDALSMIGASYTPSELLQLVLRDRAFYMQSNGGVTLSGGEPFRQRDFLGAFLREAKAAGLHTAVETCGHFVWDAIEPLLPHVDLVYFDLKVMDAKAHRSATGVDNRTILANARRMAQSGVELVFRCPLVPGFSATSENIATIIAFLGEVGHTKVHLLPYHNMGESKLARVKAPITPLDLPSMTRSEAEAIAARFEEAGIAVVIGGSE